MTAIVEPQEGPPAARQAASSASALVPVMSDMKPPRNTTPGPGARAGVRT